MLSAFGGGFAGPLCLASRALSSAFGGNKAFGEWNQVFPNATCVVALVDRLVHRSEILAIDGDSYRLKEAKERAERRVSQRSAGKKSRAGGR